MTNSESGNLEREGPTKMKSVGVPSAAKLILQDRGGGV